MTQEFFFCGVCGVFFIVIFISIFTKIRNRKLLKSVTGLNRGTKTERDLVLTLLKKGIPAQTIFHDLYIKNANGYFTQVDLVVATRVGIIVFEVKNYSGWIFGNGHHSSWTQVLAYGKEKYRFYNPIKQNNKHISDLKKQLKQFEDIPFYSVIVFYGDCILKDISFIPNETYLIKSQRVAEVIKKLLKEKQPATYTNKHEVVNTLQKAVDNGQDKDIVAQHIVNIQDMLDKNRIID